MPPLLATVELMSPQQHGSTLYVAVLRAADNALAALEEFAKEIPEICRVGKSAGARDRLASTGVVWQAADALVALRAKGLAGVVQDVVESHTAMLKDAMAELKEWLVSTDDDGEDDEAEGEAEDEDAFWDAPKKGLSKDDTEAREKVDASLKKMKLATILLGAVAKRRLAGEGKLQDAQRLDKIAELAKSVANSGDDIGMGYYEDDADEAVRAPLSSPLLKLLIETIDRLRRKKSLRSKPLSWQSWQPLRTMAMMTRSASGSGIVKTQFQRMADQEAINKTKNIEIINEQ